MELEGYRWMHIADDLHPSSHDTSTTVGDLNKLNRERVLLTTWSTYRGKIF